MKTMERLDESNFLDYNEENHCRSGNTSPVEARSERNTERGKSR